ncbi:hypothetical protein ABJI51_05235 [Amycolatopsis sp. NEAU-NG30]|uniref:Uncharacterized protein n=1 Tax=Amycolatopsis melonis TaxID=3156488 RepID=A0ABV0L830_9PSEU
MKKKSGFTWTAKALGTGAAVGAALLMAAFPASAEEPHRSWKQAISWGATPDEAYDNAKSFCLRTLKGGPGSPGFIFKEADGRWRVEIPCYY